VRGEWAMKEDVFYTLAGYQQKEKKILTHAMEDYLEMIYRMSQEKNQIHMKDLATNLHVRASSVTKMMGRLKELGFVTFEKYGLVALTEDGMIYGRYLLHRHDVLVCFFRYLNGSFYQLEQVEKIEHFVDVVTVQNIERFLKSNRQ